MRKNIERPRRRIIEITTERIRDRIRGRKCEGEEKTIQKASGKNKRKNIIRICSKRTDNRESRRKSRRKQRRKNSASIRERPRGKISVAL